MECEVFDLECHKHIREVQKIGGNDRRNLLPRNTEQDVPTACSEREKHFTAAAALARNSSAQV
jgi:hypothetical protein